MYSNKLNGSEIREISRRDFLTGGVATVVLGSFGLSNFFNERSGLESNGADYALLVVVDGLGSVYLEDANTPNFDALMASGAYRVSLSNEHNNETLPNLGTIYSGRPYTEHKLACNPCGIDDREHEYIGPTIATAVEDRLGYRDSVIVTGHLKVNELTRPGGVRRILFGAEDDPSQVGDTVHDIPVLEGGKMVIRNGMPKVLMLHPKDVDFIGHDCEKGGGWGSLRMREHIQNPLDSRFVPEIQSALKEAGVYDKTLQIWTADHSGGGCSHEDTLEHRKIPMIVLGPGVGHGRIVEGLDSNQNVAPFILDRLGISIPMEMKKSPYIRVE